MVRRAVGPPSSTPRLAAAFAPIAVVLVALAGFLPTVMPGVGFWDTAEFQTVLPLMGTAHPTGFPTYVVLGWLANLVLTPVGDPAFRMNVLSAIIVAMGAGTTAVLVRGLTGSTGVGVAAGLGLAATPIAWSVATHADPHALHLALVAILFVLLVRWEDARTAGSGRADRWLVASAAVFALAAGNHSLTLLLAVPVGLFVLAVDPGILRRGRLVATCTAVLVVVVSLVYLELPLRAGPFPAPLVYGRPDTWEGFWYVALGEQFRGSIVDPLGGLDRKAAWLVALTAEQFGPLAIVVPFGFLATVAQRPRYALLSGTALAITVFFSASYVNADITRYYLGPALIAWTWLAILAGTVLRLLVADGPRIARMVAVAALAVVLLAPTVIALPERAAAVDRSADEGSGPWLDATLTVLEPDAVVISWWSYSTALWYAQHIDGRRPDIWIVDDRTRLDLQLGDVSDVIDANHDSRPVYLVRSTLGDIVSLRDRYVIEPVGIGHLVNVYRVIAPVRAGE